MFPETAFVCLLGIPAGVPALMCATSALAFSYGNAFIRSGVYKRVLLIGVTQLGLTLAMLSGRCSSKS